MSRRRPSTPTSRCVSDRPCSTSHREDGTALLVTSHNMREVEILCERVVILARGRIVADGTPTEIAQQFGTEDLEGAFLEVAGQTVSEAELRATGLA